MSLWSKKLISVWVLFSVVFCHKHPPVNHVLQVTLCDLELAGTGTVGSCNSQLMANGGMSWPLVEFLKTCVKHRSV
jgi:hypothetical protein